MNNYYKQIVGPITKGTNICSLLSADAGNFNAITKLGIQSKENHSFVINGKTFVIGSTGIYETQKGVNINTCIAEQDEDEFTIIDCICE